MRFLVSLSSLVFLATSVTSLPYHEPQSYNLNSRASRSGILCDVNFRSGTEYAECGSKELGYDATGNKLVPYNPKQTGATTLPGMDCDHKIELDQIFSLIKTAVADAGQPLDGWCKAHKKQMEAFRKIANSSKNLIKVPRKVNQAKKAFTYKEGTGDSIAFDANIYRALDGYMEEYVNKDISDKLKELGEGLRTLDPAVFTQDELDKWGKTVTSTGVKVQEAAAKKAKSKCGQPSRRSLLGGIIGKFLGKRQAGCSKDGGRDSSNANGGDGAGPIKTPVPVPPAQAAAEALAFCALQPEVCAAVGGLAAVRAQILAGTFIPPLKDGDSSKGVLTSTKAQSSQSKTGSGRQTGSKASTTHTASRSHQTSSKARAGTSTSAMSKARTSTSHTGVRSTEKTSTLRSSTVSHASKTPGTRSGVKPTSATTVKSASLANIPHSSKHSTTTLSSSASVNPYSAAVSNLPEHTASSSYFASMSSAHASQASAGSIASLQSISAASAAALSSSQAQASLSAAAIDSSARSSASALEASLSAAAIASSAQTKDQPPNTTQPGYTPSGYHCRWMYTSLFHSYQEWVCKSDDDMPHAPEGHITPIKKRLMLPRATSTPYDVQPLTFSSTTTEL
ncbi:hypothetical protein FA10DRAFT_281988 [Acaromyces ingoldii]|uniref:Uncharacterized protein n=1 Tax=Acaromyces ingoldii TaxID=215250 RepID=A0A316YCN7_9BASI|nr:hypothetical protein FA10DRAFT_281988 [Acaromyces ingoldii]PWN87256.1 hypothetical protein FA10DRAFT_281988 [Acaromyces ingoldii]